MKQKKWVIASIDNEQQEQTAGVSELASSVLAARGLYGTAAADFLDSSLSKLHDPYLLYDMEKAVAIINKSIEQGEKIAIYGDYDVDGITSTCVLIKYLRARGAVCEYYIPDRISEGYGLNLCAIERLYKSGCRLMITVDCGITAIDEIKFATDMGLAVVITDHHQCKDVLPCALAAVNPRRCENQYPFGYLAGVGVAFKLVCAMEKGTPIEELIAQYGDLTAVGTVADVMTLTDENRSIVTHGLAQFASGGNLGLKIMMQKLGMDCQSVTANSVSFTIAPRINAAGRLGSADTAVRLFLTNDGTEAQALAEELCELNKKRQAIENGILDEVLLRLETEFSQEQSRAIVMWGDNWHTGVIGIVSSRVADKFNVPVILIALDGDCGKGSGRSICDFNLFDAITHCAGLLEKFGGHTQAAGITIKRENLEAFRAKFCEAAADVGDGEKNVCPLAIDGELLPQMATTASIRSLEVLEPFGMGNPQPIFYMRGMTVEEVTPISRDRHMKFQLSKDGASFCAFMFGMSICGCPFVCGDQIDCAFSAEINSYRGRESVQFVLKDMIWSAQDCVCDTEALKAYHEFCDGEEIEKSAAQTLLPTRNELVAVFRHIRAQAQQSRFVCQPRALYRRIKYEAKCQINMGKLFICLDIFAEFDIFSYTNIDSNLDIKILEREGKADINGSMILKKLIAFAKA